MGHTTHAHDTAPPVALRVAYVRHKSAPVHAAEALTWPALVAKLSTPVVGAKDGLGWLPAVIEPGPRNRARVESVTALVLDLEAKTTADPATQVKTVIGPEPPTPAECAAEVGLWGWSAFVHTSHSHLDPAILPADQAHPRYRLVLRLSRALAPAEVRPLGLHVLALLGRGDCADLGCLEPARLFYLPRCPAERRALFEHHVIDGAPLDVDALLSAARREAAAVKDAAQRRPAAGRTGGVIHVFNAARDIDTMLRQHGYLPRGRGRWLHPESTTGAAGVRLLPDSHPPRVYSTHGCCPLNDGHAHDAFDLWRILDHGGDSAAAVKAATDTLGLRQTPRDPPTRPADGSESVDDVIPRDDDDASAPLPRLSPPHGWSLTKRMVFEVKPKTGEKPDERLTATRPRCGPSTLPAPWPTGKRGLPRPFASTRPCW